MRSERSALDLVCMLGHQVELGIAVTLHADKMGFVYVVLASVMMLCCFALPAMVVGRRCVHVYLIARRDE